jgi:hypothetical protein
MSDALHPNEVTVCADCLTHSCYLGNVVCDASRRLGADSVIVTVAYLKQLALEPEENYALDQRP